MNETVRRLGSAALIVEKCLDLQQRTPRPKRAVTAYDAVGAIEGASRGSAVLPARPAKAASGCHYLSHRASSQRHLKARRTVEDGV